MTTTMTGLDETAGIGPRSYHHTRTVEIAGRTVRAHVERGNRLRTSRAVADVLNDQMTWTSLAAESPKDWWHDTPTPARSRRTTPPGSSARSPNASSSAPPRSSPPSDHHTISPHLHGAISALLATSAATAPNSASSLTRSPGRTTTAVHCTSSNTPTAASPSPNHHREDCPFITSRGAQECDEDCYFPPLLAGFENQTGQ